MSTRIINIILILAYLFQGLISQGQTVSAEHNYARNSPGIVMVQAVFSATVYVNRLEMNERLFN
ncbi:MAG TPA: hypothetical protein VFX58_19420, partial [Chitinophagaceae bacterium]|nr:hypothetical protein [Chitinophagaceae bacterium]